MQIRDAAGRILACVYFEDEPARRNFSKRLSKDDARRMAQQILRLPELVRIGKGIGHLGQRSQDIPVTSFFGRVRFFAVAWENEHANIIPDQY